MMDIVLYYVTWFVVVASCLDAIAGVVLGAIFLGRRFWKFNHFPGGLPFVILALAPVAAAVMGVYVLSGGEPRWLLWASLALGVSVVVQLLLSIPLIRAEHRRKRELRRWQRDHVRVTPASFIAR